METDARHDALRTAIANAEEFHPNSPALRPVRDAFEALYPPEPKDEYPPEHHD